MESFTYFGPVTRKGALGLVEAMRSLGAGATLESINICIPPGLVVEECAKGILEEAGRDPGVCPNLLFFCVSTDAGQTNFRTPLTTARAETSARRTAE